MLANGRASAMVYNVTVDRVKCWFAAFTRQGGWQLHATKGISREDAEDLLSTSLNCCSPGTPPGTLVQKLPVVVLSCSDFDDLQSQLGGFSLEMDDLLFAVLGLIELGSLVYIFHSVAQHAVDEPSEFGSHGLGCHRRAEPSPKSAELCP